MRGMRLRTALLAAGLLAATVGAGLSGPVAHSDTAARGPAPASDPDMPGGGHMTASAYLAARDGYYQARVGNVMASGAGNLQTAAMRSLRRAEARAQQASGPGAGSPAPAVWGALGPRPIPNGQVSPFDVPVSGRATSIAVDPANSNDVYVGTAGGGVFRTLDGGSTWSPMFDDVMNSLAIGALSFAPSDPSVLYVGTGEGNGSADSQAGVGLYRINSAGGATPTIIGPINPAVTTTTGDGHAFTGESISRILVSPTDSATIFVGTTTGRVGMGGTHRGNSTQRSETGLYRSTNATADAASVAFTKLYLSGPGESHTVSDLAFDPADAHNLLVAVQESGANGGGVYRTTDDLDATPTFTQTQANAATARDAVRLTASPAGTASPMVYLLEGGSTANGAMFASSDGGATWQSQPAGNLVCSGQCWYDDPIAVDPANAQHVLIGGDFDGNGANILRASTNGGATWSASDSFLHADMHAIAFDPSNSSRVWVGNDGGVFRSDDGGADWQSMNSGGLDSVQFQSIAVHPSDPEFTIGGTQDNGTNWLQPNGTWTRADYGDGGYSAIDQSATDTSNVTMYHTYYNVKNNLIGFARVTSTGSAQDGGWTFLGCGGSNNGISCSDNTLFYAPLALGPGTPNTVYFGSDRLYRSTNSGTSMSVVSQAPITSGSAISSIAIAHQDDGVRLVGLNTGRVWGTTTGSSTLTDFTGGWPTVANNEYVFVSAVSIDPADANTAYVGLGNYFGSSAAHIWKTTNLLSGSPTWQSAGTGLPDVPVNRIVIDSTTPSNLYAATDVGVYASTDAGATWAPFGSGLPAVAVYDLAIVGAGTDGAVLRVATHGRGLWQVPIDSGVPTSIDVSPTSPSVPAGEAQSFTATAHFGDGSTSDVTGLATWTSSDPDVATFPSPGNASTGKPGTTTVQATYRGVSGSTDLTVGPPVAQSVSVTPAAATVAKGLTQQYAAHVIMSDGTEQDATSTATWDTSDHSIATVDTTGLVTAVTQGPVNVIASADGLIGNAPLTVGPPVAQSLTVSPHTAHVADGLTTQLTATATMSDGSQQDDTNDVTWSSLNPSVATVDSTGLVTTLAQGTAAIKATLGALTDQGSITVDPPTTQSLAVSPDTATVPLGLTTQLTATATMSDGSQQDRTNDVTWSSDDPLTATVDTHGLVTTVAQGATVIKATLGGVTGQSTLTVAAPALTSLTIAPAKATLRVGSTKAFAAVGHYTDGSSKSVTSAVTWSSSKPSVARITSGGTSAGKASGRAYGSSTIVAKLGGVSSNRSVITVLDRAPQISGVSPTHGAVGSTITIVGHNFTSKPATTVLFGSVKARTVHFVSSKKVKVVVPRHAKSGKITVRTDGGKAVSKSKFHVP